MHRHEAKPQPSPESDPFALARSHMVESQLRTRDIRDPAVLTAMGKVPRERFVPPGLRSDAYHDTPLPIGHNVTISQPYIVALMTQLAEIEPGDRVLEVGTGSGYQAAVLAELGAEVYSIEIIEPLAQEASQVLADLQYVRVTVRHGDGYGGWPERAPFAAILVTAAPQRVPEPLKQQLAVGGRLVLPVGASGFFQNLVVLTRTTDGFHQEEVAPVAFVPMTGKAQELP